MRPSHCETGPFKRLIGKKKTIKKIMKTEFALVQEAIFYDSLD